MAKKNYDELAQDIVRQIGGPENILSLTHCVTRLRFKLADEGKANTEEIKNIKGVMTVVQAGGQYQVVIGNDVDYAYAAVGRIPGIQLGGEAAAKEIKAPEEEKCFKHGGRHGFGYIYARHACYDGWGLIESALRYVVQFRIGRHRKHDLYHFLCAG